LESRKLTRASEKLTIVDDANQEEGGRSDVPAKSIEFRKVTVRAKPNALAGEADVPKWELSPGLDAIKLKVRAGAHEKTGITETTNWTVFTPIVEIANGTVPGEPNPLPLSKWEYRLPVALKSELLLSLESW
jgi:hypothetical protein